MIDENEVINRIKKKILEHPELKPLTKRQIKSVLIFYSDVVRECLFMNEEVSLNGIGKFKLYRRGDGKTPCKIFHGDGTYTMETIPGGLYPKFKMGSAILNDFKTFRRTGVVPERSNYETRRITGETCRRVIKETNKRRLETAKALREARLARFEEDDDDED